MKDKSKPDSVDCSSISFANTTTGLKLVVPLEMIWKPKEDITAYELAKCLPYFFRSYGTMPHEIDKSEIHFRHFEIIDRNIYATCTKPQTHERT
jgi:hypothetical protein